MLFVAPLANPSAGITGKDKRKTLLYLTDKAHELKQDYDSVSLRMGQIYYQGFSEEEIVRFEGYLDRISRNLEGWRDE